MRLERATISLEPRTVGDCADLATRFLGAHFAPLGVIWLAIAAPTLGLLYFLATIGALNLWITLAALYLASSPLGVLVGLAAIPTAFGEPIDGSAVWHRLITRGPLLILKGLCYRIVATVAGALCVIPGIWVAVRTGFFVEQAALANLDDRSNGDRVKLLVQNDFSDLMSRVLVLAMYCVMLWIMVFVTVDTFSGTVLGFPLLLGRMFAGMTLPSSEYVGQLLYRDTRVMLTLTGTGLAVYVLGRIAWFFCYVDLRVRRDLWDLELKLSREARRLEEAV